MIKKIQNMIKNMIIMIKNKNMNKKTKIINIRRIKKSILNKKNQEEKKINKIIKNKINMIKIKSSKKKRIQNKFLRKIVIKMMITSIINKNMMLIQMINLKDK